MSKWNVIRLAAICDLNMGQSPESSSYNVDGVGVPFYQGNADFGELHPEIRYYCSKPTKIAKKDDILLSVRAPIGALNIATEICCIGRGLAALTPYKNILDTKFLYYVLKQKNGELNQKGTGSTFKAINKQNLSEVLCPLPPLENQKQMAKTLDVAAELLAMRKQQLAELDNLIKSTFYHMFGDPVTNEKRWRLKKLPQLILNLKNSLKRGPFGGTLKKEIFVSEGYLVYEQNHALNNDYKFKRYFIDQKTFDELKDFEVKEGDILISCSGVYLGKLSIVPKGASPGIINQALLKISLNVKEMNQIFFVNVFSNPAFKNKYIIANRGSGIPNLPPMPVIKNINFITPPIELQTQFAAIVTKIEEQKTLVKKAINETQYLFDNLMNEYFE